MPLSQSARPFGRHPVQLAVVLGDPAALGPLSLDPEHHDHVNRPQDLVQLVGDPHPAGVLRRDDLLEGVVHQRRRPDEDDLGVLAITHFSRLLEVLEPDQVHVLSQGRIHTSGGPELAARLEAEGYRGVLGDAGTPVELPHLGSHEAGFGEDPFADPLG